MALAAGYIAGLVPSWTKWAALALMLAGAYAAGDLHRSKVHRMEAEAERARQVAQQLAASEEARRMEQARAAKVQEVQSAYAHKAAAAVAAAHGADAELDRLRAALAAAPGGTPGDPSAAIGADDAARARFVVGQCAGALAQVGAAADACEARLSSLQGYVRAALAPPASPTP